MKSLTSSDVLRALTAHYTPNPFQRAQWAIFPELRVGTGYDRGRGNVEQRLDLWVMNYWPSGGMMRIAFEVKVSRADFKNELRQRLKRRSGLLLSNKFYFAAPKGLIKPEEVPAECGLMEADAWGQVHTVVDAPFRDTPPPTFSFLASLCRRTADAEKLCAEKDARIKALTAKPAAPHSLLDLAPAFGMTPLTGVLPIDFETNPFEEKDSPG